ncbi:MAG: hypothetical protein JXJ17_00125 [Anaerolineae bacterium]|nr:hypothetical protein [Anaerolineae bacterium]
MIDWEEQVKELRQMADELEQWAMSSEGRQRLVLGRIADELVRLSKEIEHVLDEETRVDTSDVQNNVSIPDWLSDADVGRLVE